jgi:beta-glucanase (GH16 family)
MNNYHKSLIVKNNFLFILLLFCFFQCKSQSWKLCWFDEFDSTAINSNKWTFDLGDKGQGNNELQYYTNLIDNAIVKNGNLMIIAKKETYDGKRFTSARLKTEGLKSFTYGKIEARIKLPLGKGLWAAFWLLGENINEVGSPKCGEIDIMEHINSEKIIYATMHWEADKYAYYGTNIECDVTQYHIYSVEWDRDLIKWLIDGEKFWEGKISNNINGTEEFHKPFFLIINMAVGGNWPGIPDKKTVFPDTMFVDYVRVYKDINNEK